MRCQISFIIIAVLICLFSQYAVSQTVPPTIYRDRHICAGEGCDYRGTATVKRIARAYPLIGSKRPAFSLKTGQRVTVIDSEVHTRAGRYVVKRKHGRFRPGDVIFTYTYLGEGIFKIWFKGRWAEEDLGFSPWGGSAGTRCQNDKEYCFGELEKEAEAKWWVKIRTRDKRTGWILVSDRNLEWD